MMDVREQRGAEIAAALRIQFDGSAWIVPSQSSPRQYKVNLTGVNPTCTCPDYEGRGQNCKHIHAVLLKIRSEVAAEKPAVRVKPKRPTYRQNWTAYNAAQVNEKTLFLALLHDLCAGIEEPPQTHGRPRTPLRDMIFCLALKTYVGFSGRRIMGDIADAHAKGYLSKVPCYNSIFNYFADPEVKQVLLNLITESALPLKTLETNFAVDSSGFGISGYVRWFNSRYGHEQDNQDWIKMHLICGVTTNVVTAVEISGRYDHDSPYLPGLVQQTAKHFTIDEVSADKGYSSRENMRTVAACGGTPYVMYKKNATGEAKANPTWEKMWHLYSLRQEEFLAHYHRRSNIESTFSMIKAKFGDRIASKTETGQVNEALTKVLCHNICVVIQSIFEFNLVPTFWADGLVAQKVTERLAA